MATTRAEASIGADPANGDRAARERGRTSRLAIASFVLSLLWLYALGSLLGVILGVLALRRVDRSAGALKGGRLAVAGIVIGALGLVVTAILFAIALSALDGDLVGP